MSATGQEKDADHGASCRWDQLRVKHQVAAKVRSNALTPEALGLDPPSTEPASDDGAEPERVENYAAARGGRVVRSPSSGDARGCAR